MTALPQPRTEANAAPSAEAVPDPGAARGDRRSLALMLLLTVAGATVVLLAAGQTWSHGSVDYQGTAVKLSVTGSETSGLPGALALVGLAAAVAVFAVRGVARRAVGVLLALAGAGAAVTAVLAAAGSGALNHKAVGAVGLIRATATGVGHSAWPWLAVVGGALLLAAGLLVLFRGRDWPGMSARYEAPGAGRANPRRPGVAPGEESPADLWKALDRGEDPTN